MESSLVDFATYDSLNTSVHLYGTFNSLTPDSKDTNLDLHHFHSSPAEREFTYRRFAQDRLQQKVDKTATETQNTFGPGPGGGTGSGVPSSSFRKEHRRQSSLKRALASFGSSSSVPPSLLSGGADGSRTGKANVLTVFDASPNSTLSHSSHLIPTTATPAVSNSGRIMLAGGAASSTMNGSTSSLTGNDTVGGGPSQGGAQNAGNPRTRHLSHQPKKVTFDPHDPGSGGTSGGADAGDHSHSVIMSSSAGDTLDTSMGRGRRDSTPRPNEPTSCFSGLRFCIDDTCSSIGHLIRWGLIYGLISSLLASMLPLIVVRVKSIHPVEIALFRSLGHAVIQFLAIVIRKRNFLTSNHDFIYLVLASLSGAIALPLALEAYSLLASLGDAAAILYSIPIMVYLLEWVLRRRACTLFMVAAVVFTGLGVAFVFCESIEFKGMKKLPQINVTTNNVGISFALGATLVAAVQNISTHRIRNLPRITVQFWSAILCLLITLPILLVAQGEQFTFQWPTNTEDIVWISMSGVFSGLSFLFLEAAFGRDPPGHVALARLAEVILVYAYQIWILKVGLSWLSVNAALIICACAASAVYMQQYEDMTREEEHPYQPQWIN